VNRLILALAIAAVVGTFAVAGCGGQRKQQGAGKGVGFGLRAAGMTPCTGPLPGEGDASLTLYAQHDFAALVASGAGAQQHAIDLALGRNHVQYAPPAAEIASTEHSWRREALKALGGHGIPEGPCRSEVPRMTVLAPTEVVCPDQVLIPMGRPAAIGRFIRVLRKLLGVHVTPAQVGYIPGGRYSTGQYYTIPQTIETRRPYCRGS
jgi:hypothetical protein